MLILYSNAIDKPISIAKTLYFLGKALPYELDLRFLTFIKHGLIQEYNNINHHHHHHLLL